MFYNEMIAGSLSADIMDYLPRDIVSLLEPNMEKLIIIG